MNGHFATSYCYTETIKADWLLMMENIKSLKSVGSLFIIYFSRISSFWHCIHGNTVLGENSTGTNTNNKTSELSRGAAC